MALSPTPGTVAGTVEVAGGLGRGAGWVGGSWMLRWRYGRLFYLPCLSPAGAIFFFTHPKHDTLMYIKILFHSFLLVYLDF